MENDNSHAYTGEYSQFPRKKYITILIDTYSSSQLIMYTSNYIYSESVLLLITHLENNY